jgi:hypothetical protein
MCYTLHFIYRACRHEQSEKVIKQCAASTERTRLEEALLKEGREIEESEKTTLDELDIECIGNSSHDEELLPGVCWPCEDADIAEDTD